VIGVGRDPARSATAEAEIRATAAPSTKVDFVRAETPTVNRILAELNAMPTGINARLLALRRGIRAVLTATVISVTPTCRTVDRPYPVLDEARTREIVVVGHFSRGAYLPENPRCGGVQPDGTELICLDPPPMRLSFNLSKTLYGAALPATFDVFTTSHYGLDPMEFGEAYPYLILIETDGQSYVMPRYQFRDLARDDRGRLALPSWPDGYLPSWLPCELSAAEKPIALTGPRSRIRIALKELDTCPGDPLCVPGPLVELRRGHAYVRRGIALDAIQDALARVRVEELHFKCDYD
jgi:hypothetical protein